MSSLSYAENSMTNEIASQNYTFSPEKESVFVTDFPLTKSELTL